MPLLKTRSFAQSSSPDWAKFSYLSVLCVSAVRFIIKSFSVSICVNLRLIAPNALRLALCCYPSEVAQFLGMLINPIMK